MVKTKPLLVVITIEEVLRFKVQPVGQQRKDWLQMVTQVHQALTDTTIGQFRDSFIVDLVRQARSS